MRCGFLQYILTSDHIREMLWERSASADGMSERVVLPWLFWVFFMPSCEFMQLISKGGSFDSNDFNLVPVVVWRNFCWSSMVEILLYFQMFRTSRLFTTDCEKRIDSNDFHLGPVAVWRIFCFIFRCFEYVSRDATDCEKQFDSNDFNLGPVAFWRIFSEILLFPWYLR